MAPSPSQPASSSVPRHITLELDCLLDYVAEKSRPVFCARCGEPHMFIEPNELLEHVAEQIGIPLEKLVQYATQRLDLMDGETGTGTGRPH